MILTDWFLRLRQHRWLQHSPWAWCWTLIGTALAYSALKQWINTPPNAVQLYNPADPDVWLRVVMVRDWLQSGDWYNHSIARLDAPYYHSTSPWTRPLDCIIALIAYLQPRSIPLTDRIINAGIVLPPLWALAVMSGFMHALKRHALDMRAPVRFLIICSLFPLLWNYFGGGNLDHHAPMCALWVWVLVLLTSPNIRQWHHGLAGALLALLLWISPEALALIGMVLASYGWHWWRNSEPNREGMLWFTLTLAAGTALAVALERHPHQWQTPVYDSISVVHVRATWVALCGAIMLHLAPQRWSSTARTSYGVAVAVVAIASLWQWDPRFFYGPMVGMHPFIFSDFLPAIIEAQPVWKSELVFSVQMIIGVGVSIASLVYLHRHRPAFWPKHAYPLLWLAVLGTTALNAAQMRWSYYFAATMLLCGGMAATALSALPVANGDGRCPLSRLPLEKAQTWRVISVFALLLLPEVMGLFPSAPKPEEEAANACFMQQRWLVQHHHITLPPDSIVWTATDLASEMLLHTPYRTLAGNYHRDGAAIADAWKMGRWRDEATLRTHLAKRSVNALFVCHSALFNPKTSALMKLYETPKTKLPSWVQEIPLPVQANKELRPKELPRLFVVQP